MKKKPVQKKIIKGVAKQVIEIHIYVHHTSSTTEIRTAPYQGSGTWNPSDPPQTLTFTC